MKPRTLPGRLVPAVVAFGLGACGSASTGSPAAGERAGTTPPAGPSSGPTPGGAPPERGPGLPRVALAAKAGAICSAATAQGRLLKVPSNMTSSPHAAAAYFDKAVPELDAETKAFQALIAAPAVAAQWEAVVGAQLALDRLANGYRQSAHAGRQTTLADIRQLVTVGQTIANAATRLGARCT